MTGMVYQWRDGAHVSHKLNATACGEFIASLPSRAPREIVEASRSKDAPTHGHFSWRMTGPEARMRVWEQEAGQLVRAIVVVHDESPVPLPAFVSVIRHADDERAYLPTYEALSDADYREQVLAEAQSAFVALRRRYRDLGELSRIFDAIDQLTLPVAA